MKRVLAIGLVFAGAAVSAQETSDLQPPAPQPPPGQSGPLYYPGQPVPQARDNSPRSVSKQGAPEGDKKKEPEGRYVFDNNDVAEEEPEVSSAAPPSQDVHVVKKGDTLWDLSGTYFHDPHRWPQLWALNPEITNPHWIYPGNQIRLTTPTAAGEGPAPAPGPGPAPEGEHTPKITRAGEGNRGIFLRDSGFIEAAELKKAGKIVGSKEEKQLLSTLDEAYVQFGKDRKVQPGDRFSVYNPIRAVKHPVSGRTVGSIVEIFGDCEVKSVTDANIARVVIVDTIEPVERGFRVGPLQRQFKLVSPTANQRDVTGVVLATLHPHEFVGTEQLVFLDKGKKDGVEVGNQFLVVRRGDGYVKLRERGGQPADDKRFPRETIGDVVVIDSKDAYATGFVTAAAKEVLIGDRVEARK